MKVAVLSDIHGNAEALDAVLERCDGLGVERIICLGDAVGYGADPGYCVDVIRDRADLLSSWRKERQVFYAVDHQGTRSLIRFLMDDCCKADPDICGEFSRRRNGCREGRSG